MLIPSFFQQENRYLSLAFPIFILLLALNTGAVAELIAFCFFLILVTSGTCICLEAMMDAWLSFRVDVRKVSKACWGRLVSWKCLLLYGVQMLLIFTTFPDEIRFNTRSGSGSGPHNHTAATIVAKKEPDPLAYIPNCGQLFRVWVTYYLASVLQRHMWQHAPRMNGWSRIRFGFALAMLMTVNDPKRWSDMLDGFLTVTPSSGLTNSSLAMEQTNTTAYLSLGNDTHLFPFVASLYAEAAAA
jgi:hypothetical protein